jgi:RNA polymerase sigma-70 factor (ECF subfamily)
VLKAETERQVIERARNGDRKAVKQIYDRFSSYLTATCARFITNENDLRDVLQDGFVKIFTSLDQFVYRGEGSLKAWARQIMVNQCLKLMRSKRRSVPIMSEENLRDLEVVEDDDEGPPDIHNVPAEVLQRMIRELPEGYRTVLNLFVVEEKSHKEIASLLGITESTSASQFFRARKILADKLKEYLIKVNNKKK